MVKKKCEHNWKALYFRKKINGSDNQGWFKVKNYKICDKCQEIRKEEIKSERIQ